MKKQDAINLSLGNNYRIIQQIQFLQNLSQKIQLPRRKILKTLPT